MTLTELVDTRKEVFRRPKTVSEILGDKTIIPISSWKEIIPAAESRQEGEGLIIKKEVEILPEEYYSPQNFSKRGPFIFLETGAEYSNQEGWLRRNKWSPLKARIKAEKEYQDTDKRYVAWAWTDPERVVHIVHPWMVLEGYKLQQFSLTSRLITDKIEIPKSYSAKGRLRKRIRASVPSKSESKKHDILIEPITSRRDPNRFVEWTRLSTEHRCPLKSNDFTFRFRKKVTTYCPHDIAAYIALSRREAEAGRGIIFQPFPLFKEPMLRLYHTLIYHTVYEKEVINPNGNPGIRRKPLPFAAIDTILLDAWLTLENKNTFYVHSSGKRAKRMRQYDWSRDAPGMKFERRS